MTVLSYLYGIIIYCVINEPVHGIFFTGLMLMTNIIRRNRWNFLVNYQVKTHQILEFFPVNQNTFSLILHNNVYTLSMTIIG